MADMVVWALTSLLLDLHGDRVDLCLGGVNAVLGPAGLDQALG